MTDENNEEVTYYITKEEFKRRMAQNQLMLGGIAKAYSDVMVKARNDWEHEYCKSEIDQIVKDIDYNRKLMRKADIEEPYAIYFIKGEEENLFIGRVSKEQHKKMYETKPKKPEYVV